MITTKKVWPLMTSCIAALTLVTGCQSESTPTETHVSQPTKERVSWKKQLEETGRSLNLEDPHVTDVVKQIKMFPKGNIGGCVAYITDLGDGVTTITVAVPRARHLTYDSVPSQETFLADLKLSGCVA